MAKQLARRWVINIVLGDRGDNALGVAEIQKDVKSPVGGSGCVFSSCVVWKNALGPWSKRGLLSYTEKGSDLKDQSMILVPSALLGESCMI